MWSYYGSKSKIVDVYPPPKYGKIIEPFAGSARYALKYWDRDVLLVDKYDKIISIWNYLKNASKTDIMNLPNLKKGESTKHCKYLTEDEINLMGFMVAGGVASPQYIVQDFSTIESTKKRISDSLFKIKHWEIKKGCYKDIPNQDATWFIDPPYQFGGEHYKESNKNIDFNHLANWCRERQGQSIVCENTKADWMDFKPMVEMQGAMFKTTEAIWSNLPTNFDNEQLKLEI